MFFVLKVLNQILSLCIASHTNKKVEFWPNQWVVKDTSDGFKVVASRDCDEFDYMYKLGKTPLK